MAGKVQKYYGVRIGRKTGIFTDWGECRKQIMGYPNAVYKSFLTREEAEAYMQQDDGPKLDESTALVAYVDGSFRNDTRRIGYGVVLLYQGKHRCLNGEVTDPALGRLHNVAGELAAAMTAMRFAAEKGFPELIIWHDYEGIAAWCTGGWAARDPVTQAYKAFYEALPADLTVEFRKVKGHSGNRYNDMADELAKKAIE